MTTIHHQEPAPEPGRPISVRQVQKNLELLNHTTATLKKAMFWTIAMCVIFGISEAITAQTVLLDFTRNAFLAWVLAIVVTTSANFASYLAGTKWHHSKATSMSLAIVWAIVGGVLVYLRLRHSLIAAPPVSFGVTASAGADDAALAAISDQVQAALLASIYVLGGLVTAVKGYTNSRPRGCLLNCVLRFLFEMRNCHDGYRGTRAAGGFVWEAWAGA